MNKELSHIIETYNEVNPNKIENEKEFIENYVNPFIKSWDLIKNKAVQYKCRILRNLDKGEKPLDITINNKLCYFLVDDGDEDGGMFLAAAYQNLIEWQNQIINVIISKNIMNGILNNYVNLLEEEIEIQEASKEEIINIDDNVYKHLNDYIFHSSMRDIFQENKIIYKNYNNIIYNFDYIEEELGKLILPGIKKFKVNTIKFITYLFEGFRGDNSSILVDYNTKYPSRKLTDDEKDSITELLKNNNNNKFYNDVFASLQILMNEIVKENYNPDHLIYKIIEALPKFIILNQTLVKFFKDKYEYYMEEKVFTINSLVSIFEYFEALCWDDIKKDVLLDYKIELSNESKKYILNYFEENKNEKALINKINFTSALRKLISRSIAGSRQEIEIESKAKLKLYIDQYQLWDQEIVENASFQPEILKIVKDDLLVGHCWELFKLLDGDGILEKEKNKNKEEKHKFEEFIQINNKNDNEINTNPPLNEVGIKKKKEEDEEEEEEEEEREFDE